MKVSANKCKFGTREMTTKAAQLFREKVYPKKTKTEKLLAQDRMPNKVKPMKNLIGLVQIYRNFVPNIRQTLWPFHKLSRKKTATGFPINDDNDDFLFF